MGFHFNVCSHQQLPHFTGPLSPATPDLNIWEANLSPSPERDKAGNQPLCRAEEGFSLFFSLKSEQFLI
uniref:Uncharacterized protein n=1 Tax=Sander lucioperca TaxID=283035 RepID=A0A8C9ZDZ4_SANLU